MFTTHLKSLAALALSMSLANAAPVSSNCPTTEAKTFKLVANVTAFDLTPSIQNHEISLSHYGAGEDYAVLTAPGSGFLFYANGTTADFAANTETIVSDQNAYPYGMIITPGGTATVPSTNAVDVNVGDGTRGVYIDTSTGTPTLAFENGSFAACPASVLQRQGDEILLSFRQAGQRTLAGCADVDLVAYCASGDADGDEFAVETTCVAR
ncbi:hypothetical protein K490DRAFT_62334 [Saccharata proteae CBS 121410]|uniref:DUF7907 domain-containing protein n=1 Tax=Saccharata proteae CBS 121410 TaxID=1314787 RepID=A0A9P4LZ58_9PEZI|nr:hypothetical protein K490DRAFT_62334 [Saccharata proteae CBS 121410]